MSPHAVPLIDGDEEYSPVASPFSSTTQLQANALRRESLLQRADDSEVQDLICIGFGPASLAIAVALHDALDQQQFQQPHLGSRMGHPKVRFLEQQPKFAWHAGMLLPGAKMQITFIKDMATLRNPRSEFTFLNYLHIHDRLVSFTNLSTFLPQRIEYENYMRWCASWFDQVVDYGHSVESVNVGQKDARTGEVDYFRVTSRHSPSGRVVSHLAKNVVIAAGGRPNIPASLPAHHPRVIHSSQYATHIDQIFPANSPPPRKIAVIGAGQSAAEVFNNLPSHFPHAQASLLIRGSALRPSDDSPFVNEVFDPNRVDSIYAQDAEVRAAGLARDKATNYAVVRLELLEHLYSQLYSYRITHGEDQATWPQRILAHREILGSSDVKDAIDGRPMIRLRVQNNSATFCATQTSSLSSREPVIEELDVDLVIVASGYRRDAHDDMLRDVQHLKPTSSDRSNVQSTAQWPVRRDYSVEFAPGKVKSDAGVWLQGCNEGTHGLSDTLLSILAVRGGEMVKSIFGL